MWRDVEFTRGNGLGPFCAHERVCGNAFAGPAGGGRTLLGDSDRAVRGRRDSDGVSCRWT